MAPPMRKNYPHDPTEDASLKEDAFPHFSNHDVRVIINGPRQYRLHRHILVRASPVLARLLSEESGAKLSSRAKSKGMRARWRLDACSPRGEEENEHGVDFVLRRIDLDDGGKSILQVPVNQDSENGRVPHRTHIAYTSFFRACYGLSIDEEWSNIDDFETVVSRVYRLHQVAKYLQAIPTVAKPIEAALLPTGQKLYNAITTSPPGWLAFGTSIQSKPIFKEALIHAAGQYNTPEIQQVLHNEEIMAPEVREIVKNKAQTLLDMVKIAELNMLSYYPEHLQRKKDAGNSNLDQIRRDSYSNDIMGWIGLTAFRHWLSQSLAEDQTHQAKDMGFAFVSLIEKGQNAYLTLEDMKDFHGIIPMTDKGMAIVAGKVKELKNHVKGFLGHLLDHNAAIDEKSRKFLTCTVVEHLDYPWLSRKRGADFEDDEDDGEVDEGMEVPRVEREDWEEAEEE